MAVWSKIKLSELRGTFRLDAEFWRPEYLRVESQIRKQSHKKLGELSLSLRKGVFNILADSYVDEGVPFYRSSNVGSIIPKSGEPVFITSERHAEEHKTSLSRGDIMLAKTGKEAASVILVDECNVSQDVIALRPDRKQVNPFYLAVYLNTNAGILEMRRWFQGQVQLHLSLPDSRRILVPLPSSTIQDQVEALVLASEAKTEEALNTIASAESRLVLALGLDGLDLAPEKTYTRSFRELEDGRCYGAEYYMPCKMRALKALAAMPHKPLSAHAPGIRDMFNPLNARPGQRVRNFDLTDALEPVLDDTMEPTDAAEIGSTKKRFRYGDLVVSRLRSYLKEIALVRTTNPPPPELERTAFPADAPTGPKNTPASVGSSEFIVLRPRKDGLSAETLMVYLRCPVVQNILKWSQNGSNHPRFEERDLLSIPVPNKLLKAAPEIDEQVNASLAARSEAGALLEQAKRRVEQLISEA